MGRIWRVPLLFFLLWVCGARAANACSCAPRGASCGPPGDFWRAAAVFTARVTAVERAGPPSIGRLARVRIIERFRGAVAAPGEEALLAAGFCGYPFRTGQEYFIYAARLDDGRLAASVCSQTRPLERAAVDLKYARDAASGQARPGRIVGTVGHAAAHDPRRQPIPGVRVTLTGQGTTIGTSTDARGNFTFEAPGAGRYEVGVALPTSRYASPPVQVVDLADSRACLEANVETYFDGHVDGQILDSAGKGIAGLTVAHVQVGRTAGQRTGQKRTLTRDDGTFRIERLPPGPFVVAVELPVGDLDPDGADALALAELAKHGALGEGERLALGRWSLPASVRMTRLEGTVHTVDGAPASGARVFLKSATESGRILGEPAVADSLGRFLIAALDESRYQVFAEFQASEDSRSEFSAPVALTATRNLPPLRLTIRRRF
jgi:hypothetical protein